MEQYVIDKVFVQNFIIIIAVLLIFVLLYIIKNLRSKIAILKKTTEKENDQKQLLENLPFPVFFKRKDSKLTYKNRAFSVKFGINEKKAIEQLTKHMNKPKEQVSFTYDNNIQKQALVLQSSILDINREIQGKVGAIFDVDSFEKDINLLIEWKKRYNLAVENCGYGMWDWDILNNSIYFSSKWKEIMGYRINEETNSLNSWLNQIDAKDITRVNETLDKHLKGENEIFIVEHRLKLGKSLKWIHVRGHALFDHDNNAIRMTGLIVDVTDKKEIESRSS